jgi:large subunit ribosomal protein L5e
VKTQKNSAYYKRYQTRFRRRRECRTDYQARKRMIIQDANKYGTPKYRLVVRFTNRKVITQIVYATTKGDKILCAADSSELAQWGLTTGQSSYAAAYATGLLIARRLLKQLKLDTIYKGAKDVDGKDYDVSAEAESFKNAKRPFKAILDIGMINNTVGHRVFAALKGACDGGLHIPHSTRKFYGSEKNEETKEWEFHPEANKDRVLGVHIDEYMGHLKGDKEALKRQFNKWSAALTAAKVNSVQDLFKKVHAGIKANPERKKKQRTKTEQKYENKEKTVIVTKKGKYLRDKRLTKEQRKANIQKKLKAFKGLATTGKK